jgi:hypothetical protein
MLESNTLVQRLRHYVESGIRGGDGIYAPKLLLEAADTIERLERELASASRTLRTCPDCGEERLGPHPDCGDRRRHGP